MAFPISPVDGQLYTNSLGTVYRYSSASTAWKISTQTVFTSVTLTLEYPSASELLAFYFSETGITIDAVDAAVRGSSTPSVTIDPYYTTDMSGAGVNNKLFSSPQAITSTTTPQNFTSFSNNTPGANNWIMLSTTAMSGTVTAITITITYHF
jgi:hypothetical protein